MVNKKRVGSALIYVLILWGVISLFLSLVVVLFSSSVSGTYAVKNYLQNDYLQKNISQMVRSRYVTNAQDYKVYSQQDGFTHTVTRFSDEYIVFLNSEIESKKDYFYEFHRDQREIEYVDPSTGDTSNNHLEDIKNWEIYWDMKTDITIAQVAQYNPLQIQESTDLRVTVLKFGAQVVKKCFYTSAGDVTVLDPGVASAFQKKIVLDESYFKSTSLSNDCDEVDPDDDSVILNANGVLPIDFSNNRYIIKIEPVSGSTHVHMGAVGNNGVLPTEYLFVGIIPDFEGVPVDEQYFLGGVDSAIFSYLTNAERTIGITIYDDEYTLDFDHWQHFLGVLTDKY